MCLTTRYFRNFYPISNLKCSGLLDEDPDEEDYDEEDDYEDYEDE